MASSNAFMDELYSVEYAQFALRVGDHCHTRSISSKAWHYSALNCVKSALDGPKTGSDSSVCSPGRHYLRQVSARSSFEWTYLTQRMLVRFGYSVCLASTLTACSVAHLGSIAHESLAVPQASLAVAYCLTLTRSLLKLTFYQVRGFRVQIRQFLSTLILPLTQSYAERFRRKSNLASTHFKEFRSNTI